MATTDNLTAEQLFRKVLRTDIITKLKKSSPLDSLVPYLFYKLFKKYGKGEMTFHLNNDSDRNESIIFEMDSEKTGKATLWVKAKIITDSKGNSIEFFSSMPHVYSGSNPPVMEINCYSNDDDPFVYMHGPEICFQLGRNDDKNPLLRFIPMLQVKEIFPLHAWTKTKLAELQTT